jgi:hypothetical protein
MRAFIGHRENDRRVRVTPPIDVHAGSLDLTNETLFGAHESWALALSPYAKNTPRV